jgi:thiol-disulfide isomerase/thioredoxin
MRTSCITLSFLLFVSVSIAQNKEPRKLTEQLTILTADSNLFTPNDMWPDSVKNFDFAYTDLLSLKTEKILLSQKEVCRFKIESPTFLFSLKEPYPYIVYPGEQIHVSMDSSFYLEYKITLNEQRTADFKCLRQYWDKAVEPYYYFFNATQSPDLTLHQIYKLEADIGKFNPLFDMRRKKLADSLKHVYKVTDTFSMNLEHHVRSDSLKRLLVFYFHYWTRFDSVIIEKKLKEISKAYSFITHDNLMYYAGNLDLLIEIIFKLNKLREKVRNHAEIDKQYHVISLYFKGLVQDYFLSKTCYSAIVARIPGEADYLARYTRLCDDTIYENTVLDEFRLRKELDLKTTGNEERNFVNLKTEESFTWPELLDSFRGNVVYIDIWASWCAPCRQEFPESRMLHAKYEGKNVKFIYISIDKDFRSWKKASFSEKLRDENSFIINNFPGSRFENFFRFKTIPRYMIIDKFGKIAYSNAPRPGNHSTQQIINKLLNK